MEETKLREVLALHRRWLMDEGGERADLSDADLRNADLRGAYLRNANLYNACLYKADLSGADLRGAMLCKADMRKADLSVAALYCADLRMADLWNADLNDADLSKADLRMADLRKADLRGVDLRGANLKDIQIDMETTYFALQCPEEGSYIGFKKCRDGKIVKLLIPEDAKRSSATSRKCRASKAKVINITNPDETEFFEEAVSLFDRNFIYRVGEIVEVEDFDGDRWNECAEGIHHFITRQEAVKYQ